MLCDKNITFEKKISHALILQVFKGNEKNI